MKMHGETIKIHNMCFFYVSPFQSAYFLKQHTDYIICVFFLYVSLFQSAYFSKQHTDYIICVFFVCFSFSVRLFLEATY